MIAKDSIFYKVLLSRIQASVIPVIILSIIFGGYVCYNHSLQYTDDMQNTLDEYAYNVTNAISARVEQSTKVLSYTYIIENINKVKTDHEVFVFQQNTGQFLEYITGEKNRDELLIYSSNGNTFNDKYFRRISDLPERERIIEKLKKEDGGLIWEKCAEEIDGEICLVFYRYMPYANDSILACRVYIPKGENISIVAKSDSDSQQDGRLYSEINDVYTAVMTLDNRVLHKYNAVVILLAAAAVLALSLFLIFIIIKTTRKVTSGIDEFVGNISEDVLLDKDYEINISDDDLAEVKRMKGTIDSLIAKIREISEKQHRLEVELLQKQIDSHTLYNSLSAIKYNAFLRGDKEMEELIGAMVAYYRASLGGGRNITTLGEELEMMRKYIFINEASHAKKYNLTIEVEEGLENCTIPHFLLQPFVENCVIHGLAGKRADCSIYIGCWKENDSLCIDISDNGYGLETETLKMLSNLEHYKKSYGIKNVYTRLKLLYGDSGDIVYESEKGRGTTVHLKLKTDIVIKKSDMVM